MSPLGCSTTAAVGRRYRKAPTAEEAAEQREAWNQAQQEMADRQAAVAAARSATLQRNRAAHCVGQLFGYEEDLHIGSDEGYVADDMDDDGDVGPRNGGQQRQPSGGPGHGERRLRYEQAFQRENEKAVQYRTLLAAEHAAAERRDMGQQLAAVQQKVVAYSGQPHPPRLPQRCQGCLRHFMAPSDAQVHGRNRGNRNSHLQVRNGAIIHTCSTTVVWVLVRHQWPLGCPMCRRPSLLCPRCTAPLQVPGLRRV